jgi:hypothetical protein
MSGDARERCDVGVSLHKSFLFLQTPSARLAPRAVKCGHREKQLKGRKSRDTLSWLEALTTVQKKHRDPMDVRRPAPKRRAGRVFVCSVAVPISATGAKAEEALVEIENVGQGSRQNRLVTLEEELALWDE